MRISATVRNVSPHKPLIKDFYCRNIASKKTGHSGREKKSKRKIGKEKEREEEKDGKGNTGSSG